MNLVRNQWARTPEFRGVPNNSQRIAVLRAILECYHDDPSQNRPIIFDKSRGWMGRLDLAEEVLGRKIKVLVSVRDVRDVIASFERLWRKNTAHRQFGQEAGQFHLWQTLLGRCEVWMSPRMVVGSAVHSLQNALLKGYRDRMHFIEFEELTRHPKETMEKVYEFLGEPYYEHDFDHVEQVTHEDDEMHGIPELHIIRPKIEPVEPQWPKYLGREAKRWESFNDIWRKPDGWKRKYPFPRLPQRQRLQAQPPLSEAPAAADPPSPISLALKPSPAARENPQPPPRS